MKNPKVAIVTFGCKINQYESSCIINDFAEVGYNSTKFDDLADVYVINTCTVTNRTDAKSRSAIRKALKKKEDNKNIKVIVTGCYAQRKYDEIRDLGDVDLIVDNNKKNRIIDLIDHPDNCFEDILTLTDYSEHSTSEMIEHSRAFLKIQDGCDYYCTYCAIPYARGHSRSRKPEKVINQVKKLIKNGYQEIVLGGINLGLYGRDLEGYWTLTKMLLEMEKIEGLSIIRLSSIEPNLFDEELLAFIAKSKKIAPHFHIPLQSGCDEILKKMKRKYTTKDFINQINRIQKVSPDCALGFDLIVGFPGETEKLFAETYSLLESIDFTYLHLFTYSPKSGTPAAEMKNQVNGTIVKDRINRLKKLEEVKKNQFIKKIIDNKIQLTGIAEKPNKDHFSALSNRFIRIYWKSAITKRGQHIKGNPIKKIKDGILVNEIN